MAGDRAAESLQPGSQSGRESVCVCVERLGTGADKEPCAVCPAQRTLGGGEPTCEGGLDSRPLSRMVTVLSGTGGGHWGWWRM